MRSFHRSKCLLLIGLLLRESVFRLKLHFVENMYLYRWGCFIQILIGPICVTVDSIRSVFLSYLTFLSSDFAFKKDNRDQLQTCYGLSSLSDSSSVVWSCPLTRLSENQAVHVSVHIILEWNRYWLIKTAIVPSLDRINYMDSLVLVHDCGEYAVEMQKSHRKLMFLNDPKEYTSISGNKVMSCEEIYESNY